MLCRRPVVLTQPNSRCSASCTGAGQVLRARFFRLEPGPLRGLTRTLIHPRLGPSGASTSPRIWNRSINGRKFSVKRKTLNVVDVFVLRLFVVVPFPLNRFLFNTIRRLASHATLFASYSICNALSPRSPSFSFFLFPFLRKRRRRPLLLPSHKLLTAKNSISPEFPTPGKFQISSTAARSPEKWVSLS